MILIYNGKEKEIIYNNKIVDLSFLEQVLEQEKFYMSRNLFDKNNMDGTYSNTINVTSGQQYKIYRTDTGGMNTQYIQLDSNGEEVSNFTASADGVFIANGATKLKINTYNNQDTINYGVIIEGSHCYEYNAYNENIEYSYSKFNGKRWLVLGDSISTGNGDLASHQFASKPYHYLIAKEKGIITTNLAVSGYTTQNIYDNKVSKLYGDYYPDLITVFCGVNDINFYCDTETYYDLLLTKLQELYPLAKIGCILPLDYAASDDRLPAKLEIIKTIANNHNIKYLDLYKKTGWDFKSTSDLENYTCPTSDGGHDGLHPNNLGHQLIAPKISSFIETL